MSEVCTVNYIDHVGVAVKDIEAALAFFKKVFDMPDAEIVLMEDQGVKATLIEVGQTRLELLEPPSMPVAIGVLYCDPESSYEDGVKDHMDEALKHSSGHDINALLRRGHTWTITG